MSKNPPLLQEYSLTPSEIKLLRQKASEIKHLEEGELELIQAWSDPRNPPPRYLFEHWEQLLVNGLILMKRLR